MAPHRPYMAFPKTNTRYMFKPPTDTNIYSPRNTVPCSLIALRSLLSISYLLSLFHCPTAYKDNKSWSRAPTSLSDDIRWSKKKDQTITL